MVSNLSVLSVDKLYFVEAKIRQKFLYKDQIRMAEPGALLYLFFGEGFALSHFIVVPGELRD